MEVTGQMAPLFHAHNVSNNVMAGTKTASPGEMDFILPPVVKRMSAAESIIMSDSIRD